MGENLRRGPLLTGGAGGQGAAAGAGGRRSAGRLWVVAILADGEDTHQGGGRGE